MRGRRPCGKPTGMQFAVKARPARPAPKAVRKPPKTVNAHAQMPKWPLACPFMLLPSGLPRPFQSLAAMGPMSTPAPFPCPPHWVRDLAKQIADAGKARDEHGKDI